MRLFYHGESGAYFLEEPGEWQETGDGALCDDVSDYPEHRSAAVLEGIDLSQITDDDDDDFWAMPTELEHVVLGSTEKTIVQGQTGGISGAIAAAMAKWARKPADLYPTPIDCTYSLLPHIAALLPPDAKVWEPACADGQMVQPLREFGYNVMATDLRPDVLGGAGGIDFLEASSTYHTQQYDAVITNPPFAVAEKFIVEALKHAPVVAMLLKAQYWNTKNRKKLFRDTKPYMELNLTWRPAFLEKERGKSPLMDCMWVVWVRGHEGLPKMDMIDRLMVCPVNVGTMDMGGL